MRDVIFPVTCPECKRESLMCLPAATINRTLASGQKLTLRSRCHGIQWPASAAEAEQIKDYLWAAQIA